MLHRNRSARSTRRGSALLLSLVVVLILSGVAVAMLSTSVAIDREASSSLERARALQLAEAGVSDALAVVGTLVPRGETPPTNLGDAANPVERSGGRYWCTIEELDPRVYRVTSVGTVGFSRRRVESVLVPLPGIFDYALFAGNTSADPSYTATLGGTGVQADTVIGNVYSGGDLDVQGDASVTGQIDVRGTVAGATGSEGISRTPPDLAAMDYPTTADFDVAALFASATPGSVPGGGTALQVPEDNPAHIFRRNPDDRAGQTAATAKDDYFLEDPYEPMSSHTFPLTGLHHHTLTLSGTMGEPGVNGSNKVYFVDGNLWLHSGAFYGIRFRNTDSDHARVTFVVRGNIYFSDDVEMDDPAQDGVAFIAMIDPAVADSGNIYFGDPAFGTLRAMHGYMFAENDFHDNNLTGSSSDIVTILGAMTAGNHVNIVSDWVDSFGVPQHSRLELINDDRLQTGVLELPGIPRMGRGAIGYDLVYWRELARE